MKKLKAAGVALFSSALIATGSGAAHASAGWDYVGSSEFTRWDEEIHFYTNYHLSTGGDFRTCHTSQPEGANTFTLWEYDPNGSKKVRSYSLSKGCFIFKNIGNLVDGDNNKAEFFISTNLGEGGVAFYD
ncbi:hypothetical protein [Streptomyces sp. NPDC050355]|uniref:hypothetical protein n=1 Tax=Streptomyces sp. NPDC050355 TaxID=3365609 RepID=UPI0037A8EF8A